MAWIGEQVYAAILDRRANPQSDMISALVAAELPDRPITDERLLAMIMLVIIGGVDTTTAVIGNALLYLHRHPAARDRLIAEPGLMEPAVEEFLRWQAPVQGLARHCTRDTQVDGQQVRAGDTVMLLWGSANRDPEHFPDPDEVILDRFPNRHLTFGVGAHRCLGSTIARNEVRIVLSEVLRRLPDYRILEDEMVRAETVGTVYGHVNMPTVFSPSPPTRPTPGATT
jgi:cytochrome P450